MSETHLPRKLYRVTRSGGTMRYLSPVGRTFASLLAATMHAEKIAREDGAETRIYECDPEWREVPQS